MNRKEAMRQTHQMNALQSLGFTADEAESLRRISMTLRRWYELECGTEHGCIYRNEETGQPLWHNANSGSVTNIPDRETGAKKRLAKILVNRLDRQIEAHANRGNLSRAELAAMDLDAYIQTDPRGAALYIIRPGDVPEGSAVESCYSRGICVY